MLPLLQKQLNIVAAAGYHPSKVDDVQWASGLNEIVFLSCAISILSVQFLRCCPLQVPGGIQPHCSASKVFCSLVSIP